MAGKRWKGHLGLKILSVLIGFSMWYAVAREQEAEFAISIPIELRQLPEGLEVLEESVQQVEVRVRGPAEILRRLTPQDLSIGVDLSDAGAGEQLAYLTPREVSAPFGARVMRVTPTSVRIVLDRTLQRRVGVIPRVVGSPAEGFELYNIELLPREIDIVGPASRIEGLDQVTTEPVSADGLREPYSRIVRVELDPLVRLARETTVVLTLDVREERIWKEISGVPLRMHPEATRARPSPQSLRVVVEGPKSIVELLSADDVRAELRLEGLPSGRHSVTPLLRVEGSAPDELRILSVRPEEVTVRIP